MKTKNESSLSLTYLLSLTGSLVALMLFSSCNSSASRVVATGTGVPTPVPTVCPAWGCGNPPIIAHPFPVDPTPTPTATPIGPEPCAFCIIASSGSSVGASDSVGDTDTKDVDLQRADLQTEALNDRASEIAQQFGMSFDSAHELAVLADRVQALNAKSAVSPEDEQSVIQAALGIAGLSQEEVTSAVARSLQGDDSGVNALMDKAATNLGMSSTATLRDQLLPALGISN